MGEKSGKERKMKGKKIVAMKGSSAIKEGYAKVNTREPVLVVVLGGTTTEQYRNGENERQKCREEQKPPRRKNKVYLLLLLQLFTLRIRD